MDLLEHFKVEELKERLEFDMAAEAEGWYKHSCKNEVFATRLSKKHHIPQKILSKTNVIIFCLAIKIYL